ncbi:YegS/Rv2252/BmrU family lipid kinase [soil metagenome]|jgi:diacylglycerol kinase (ATP)
MKIKHIHFIINPASGAEAPILTDINKVFCESGITWDVSITKKDGDAYKFASAFKGKTDIVAVYGGDGSLTEVAGALYGSRTPMAIIPGGTANVTAKELNIPLSSVDALELLKGSKSKVIKIDMGMANGEPFLIRINLGIMADMIIRADRELKDSMGQLAYGITAIKSIAQMDPVSYILQIDGKEFKENAVALTVTNAGSLGIGTMSLLPGISIKDGLLDVILLNDASIMSVLSIAGTTLLQNDSDILKHWRCKEVEISSDKLMPYIHDDVQKRAKKLHLKVMPGALKILVPASFKKQTLF